METYENFDDFKNNFAEKLKDPENTMNTVEEMLNSVKDLFDEVEANKLKLKETDDKYQDMRIRYLEKLQSETRNVFENTENNNVTYTDNDYQNTLKNLRG